MNDQAEISFLLVSIPVRVVKTTKGETTKKTPTYGLHKACLTKLEQIKVCPTCDVRLEPDEIVRGVKQGKHYVAVDLEPEGGDGERSKTITVTQFTRDQLAAVRTHSAYWLVPDGGGRAEELFAVFTDTMASMGVSAFGFNRLWGVEYPTMIEPMGDMMLLRRLHHDSDMVNPSPGPLLVPGADKMKAMAGIVNEMLLPIDPAQITTEHRQWREQQIAHVLDVGVGVPVDEHDIMAQMQESVALLQAAKKKPRRKKAASR